MSDMRLLQHLWALVPESPLKDLIRIAFHNRAAGGVAHFSVCEGVFACAMDGVQFKTRDHPFAIAEAQRRYQARHRVQRGEVVIDAGAFHGHLSLYFAFKVGPVGRVIVIEPDRGNVVRLDENLRLNGSPGNITLVAKALWDRKGEIEFSEVGDVCSSAFWTPQPARVRKTPTTTIDDIAKELSLSRVDFVKMDVEGAELKALAGAERTINLLRPELVVASYHVVDGHPTYPAVEQKLRKFGYRPETVFYGRECLTYAGPAH